MTRGLYLGLKWALVALGAFALGYNFVEKWGMAAAAWFLIAPLAYGVYRGLTGPPSPPQQP